jgi:hypothetical protein
MSNHEENALALKKTEKEDFLKDNPAVIDIDIEYNKIINGFIKRFKGIAGKWGMPLNSDQLAVMFAGPSQIDTRGFKPYTNLRDMFSFFTALSTRLIPQENQLNKLWELFESIIPYCKDTNTLYDGVMNAIYTHKPEVIDTNVMLTLLGNSTPTERSTEHIALFTECVPIKHIGQLLNSCLSPKQRSEFIYSEIKKGLRNDRTDEVSIGISPYEIIDFFTKEKANIILSYFDINLLIVNIYIDLYNITNLDKHIERQIKNLELQYSYLNQQNKNDGGEIKEFDKKGLIELVTNQLSEQYINAQLILDRLLTLQSPSGGGVTFYTLAYILINASPESFFVYSSYTKALNSFINLYTSDSDNKETESLLYYKPLKDIIRLNPNINIPYFVMDTLFNKNDLDELITGLKIGFSRYALYAFQKFDDIINRCKGNEDNFHYFSVNKYLKSSYIEKLNYIITDVAPVLDKLKTECSAINNSQEPKCAACGYATEVGNDNEEYICALENDPCVTLRKSNAYDDLDLIGTLIKTNTYIQELTRILTIDKGESESESEQTNQ